jgi:hypothetical protein
MAGPIGGRQSLDRKPPLALLPVAPSKIESGGQAWSPILATDPPILPNLLQAR